MLGALVTIIDRLIQLTEYRNRSLRAINADILTPIFHDLTEIHMEYGKLFEGIRQFLPDRQRHGNLLLMSDDDSDSQMQDGLDINQAVEYLRTERRRFEPVRLRLTHMLLAVDYSTLRSPAARDFIDSVIRYFPRGCSLAEISKFPPGKRTTLPESTAGLLAADDNWSKTLESALRQIRDLPETIVATEHGEFLEHAEFFIRWSYSDICSKYAKLKVEIASIRT